MARCSKCGGNNAKRQEVVAAEGSSTSSNRTTGVGFGTGGVGIGVGNTRTTTRSQLAENTKFEHDESMLSGLQSVLAVVFALLIGAIFAAFVSDLIFGYDSPIWFFAIIFIPSFGLLVNLFSSFGPSKKNEYSYAAARELYKRKWICLDCGAEWVESGSSESSRHRSAAVNNQTVSEIISDWEREARSQEYRSKRSKLNYMGLPDHRLIECNSAQLKRVIELYQEIISDLPGIYSKDAEAKTLASRIKKFEKKLVKAEQAALQSQQAQDL